MSQTIDYRVEPINPQAHLFRVTLTIQNPSAEGETLSLPAWIPGSYMIREFSKNLVEVRAEQGGRSVLLNKLDKHTWRTGKLLSTIALEIQTIVYAWDLSVRCAYLEQSRGFFNGTQLFLCVNGREELPHRLEICRPVGDEYAGWRVATTLRAAGRGRRGIDGRGFGTRVASNYDELIDHPVEMGEFASFEFAVCGVPHQLVISGRGSFDAKRLTADLQKACEAVVAVFGEPLPFERYLFMVKVVGEGYGGLEHRASTALICARTDLPAVGSDKMDEAYRGFLGLCSHEYFHAWNVKRIKPEAFMPYRLHEENYTRLLWVFEGFTSYYDDLALVRAGLISRSDYLGLVAKTIAAVERGSGRLKQSLADSSFDAWIKYYRQDENSPNAIVSYYQKGALVALGLDLTIRNKTAGQRSLDDVMRYLWSHYGEVGLGVPEDGIPKIIKAATNVDVRREIAAWVYGCEDVPLARLFKPFGVELVRKPAGRVSGLGMRVKAEGLALRVSHVLDGGSAQSAGLSAGDELVAVNSLRVSASNLDGLLQRCKCGAAIDLHVFRRDELHAFSLLLQEPCMEECELKFGVRQTDAAQRLQDAWFGVSNRGEQA